MNYYVPDTLIASLLLVVAWELAWKLIALVKAAKARDWFWFLVILATNSVGILQILYVFYGEKFVGPKTPHKP